MSAKVDQQVASGSTRCTASDPFHSEPASSGKQNTTQIREFPSLRERAKKFTQRAILVSAIFTVLVPLSSTTESNAAAPAEYDRQLIDCNAENNLWEIADFYISRCRKASVRRKFPGQHLYDELGSIKRGAQLGHRSAQTAWKLLNDNSYKK
jgi:hypothetical protein